MTVQYDVVKGMLYVRVVKVEHMPSKESSRVSLSKCSLYVPPASAQLARPRSVPFTFRCG
ncbi:hypothetical protein EON62_05190 [archaeon]|nr:MAG: hypothetical protein EON62_05190 [archaeon]